MFFWSMAALLTLAASLSVLLPLTRGSRRAGGGGHDLEVYRDQLAELDRDVGRGLIRPVEAEEARAEIGRRILRADADAGNLSAAGRGFGPTTRIVAAAAVLAVPLVSWGFYAAIGSPDIPSQPLAERLARNPADSSVDELVARAEAYLAANPSDGRGWDVLAPIYVRLGRFDQAVNAFRNAIKLDGATAERESGLGEAIVAAGGGLVSAEAHAAFEHALAIEPGQAKARFYIATGLAQEGKLDQAISAWQAMLAALPPDSPWRDAAGQSVAEAQRRLASANQAPGSGPGQAEIDAAAGMTAADRSSMIETMVASLDEKLRQNPRDVDGWTRLVRSYLVLGRADDARDAVKRATQALGADSEEAKRITDFSASLGLTATD